MPEFEQPLGSQYLLGEEIGHGGMGTVWRGRRRDSDVDYAIKVLRPELAGDPEVVARFVRERTLLVKLRHRNIVTVHDMIVEGNRLALVMDLIPGENLGVYRRQHGTLPAAEATWLMAQLCDALAAAHAAGVVHRDVKPGNILLDQRSSSVSIKLTDFGISRIFDSTGSTSANTVILGTPDYLAPEVALGDTPLPSSDVYAVGITLYELIVGRAPYSGGATGAVLMRHIEAQPLRIPGMGDELWEVISSCLAKQPRVRPAAADLALRLRELTIILADTPALTPIGENADVATYVLPRDRADAAALAATSVVPPADATLVAGDATRGTGTSGASTSAAGRTRVTPRPVVPAPTPRHRAAIAGISAAAVFLIAGGVAAAVGITSQSGAGAPPSTPARTSVTTTTKAAPSQTTTTDSTTAAATTTTTTRQYSFTTTATTPPPTTATTTTTPPTTTTTTPPPTTTAPPTTSSDPSTSP